MAAAHADKRLKNGVVTGAVARQQHACRIAVELRDGEKDMLRGDVFVFETRSFIEGAASKRHLTPGSCIAARRRILSGDARFRAALLR